MYASPSDGYVRMSLAQLRSTSLSHLISNLDEGGETMESDLASPATGYSEWIGSGFPALTLGWDWRLELGRNHVKLTLLNEPRSNIMLLDDQGTDLGPETTRRLLAEFVDDLPWRDEVIGSIDIRTGK
jgi:hypothetical protein